MKNSINKKEEILKRINTAIKIASGDIECNRSVFNKEELELLLQALNCMKEQIAQDDGTLTSKLTYETDLNFSFKNSSFNHYWRISIMLEQNGVYLEIDYLPINVKIKETVISTGKVDNTMNNNIYHTMKTQVAKDLMTVEDLQFRYGIGKNKAYSLVKCKGFPSFQIYGRYYIKVDDLMKWEEKAMQTKVKQGGQRLW